METTIWQTEKAELSFYHNHLSWPRPTLLFLHGLGDSALAFNEVLSLSAFAHYNLILPDMPGYGRSAANAPAGISFDDYVRLLITKLTQSGCRNLVIIAHSMGGAIGSLICGKLAELKTSSDDSAVIQAHGFVNIEGNLLPADQFLSRSAVEQANRSENDYMRWMRKFKSSLAPRLGLKQPPALVSYYKSLCLCHPGAFLANSHELVKRSGLPVTGELNEIAALYLSLTIPKLYCLGSKSHPPETLALLKASHELNKVYTNAGHSLMIDKAEDFYSDLSDFVHTVFKDVQNDSDNQISD